jgi:branched-chain amino acid transport system substrate-binding protein
LAPLRLVAMVAAMAIAVAGCGSDDSAGGGPSTTAASADQGATPAKTTCGEGSGEKATCTPIKVGALATKVPGLDFTPVTDAAKAYFDCVNDNGGIKGHPIQYLVEKDVVDPQRVSSLATKLAEVDKVDAFVASISALDCTVNGKYYEQHGFDTIVVGVPNECFNSPNIAAVNMGPLYSSLGATRYLIDKAGAKGTIVVLSPKQPGAEAVNDAVLAYAKQRGLKTVSRLEVLPIADPAAVAQALVAQAGDGGGVVLDVAPPAAVPILKAAEQQGIMDKVKWGAITTLADASVPKALGTKWDGKLFVSSDFATLQSDGADMQLYRAVNEKYLPDSPISSFGQMGFLSAKVFTDAVSKLPEDELNRKGINQAVLDIKDFTSDLLCKPWYFQDMKLHVPNNAARTLTVKDGGFAEAEGCADIPASYPDVK